MNNNFWTSLGNIDLNFLEFLSLGNNFFLSWLIFVLFYIKFLEEFLVSYNVLYFFQFSCLVAVVRFTSLNFFLLPAYRHKFFIFIFNFIFNFNFNFNFYSNSNSNFLFPVDFSNKLYFSSDNKDSTSEKNSIISVNSILILNTQEKMKRYDIVLDRRYDIVLYKRSNIIPSSRISPYIFFPLPTFSNKELKLFSKKNYIQIINSIKFKDSINKKICSEYTSTNISSFGLDKFYEPSDEERLYDLAGDKCDYILGHAPQKVKTAIYRFAGNHFKGKVLSFFEFFNNNFIVIGYLIEVCSIEPFHDILFDFTVLDRNIVEVDFNMANVEKNLREELGGNKSYYFVDLFEKYFEMRLLPFEIRNKIKIGKREIVGILNLNKASMVIDPETIFSSDVMYFYLEKVIFVIVYFTSFYPELSEINLKKLTKGDFKILKSKIILLKNLGGWDLFSKRSIFTYFFSYSPCLLKILYKPRILKAFKTSIKNKSKF